jgi:hypothetical protein
MTNSRLSGQYIHYYYREYVSEVKSTPWLCAKPVFQESSKPDGKIEDIQKNI